MISDVGAVIGVRHERRVLGKEYYIWVDKDPQNSYPDNHDKTDGTYGWPGLYLLPTPSCP